jgi:hypothetical protein
MMAMMGLSSGWFVGNSETILPTDDPTRRHSSAEQGFEQFWVVLADNVGGLNRSMHHHLM